jgi:hypothetical protein
MAQLTVVTGCDPHRLFAAAADGFLELRPATPADPFPSPAYLLALRHAALRDDLVALAAAHDVPGWFDPPVCSFHELPHTLGTSGHAVCGDFARAALLAHLLRRKPGSVFSRVERIDRFVDAVDTLMGEFAAEGFTPNELEAAWAAVGSGSDFIQERNAELVALYRDYCTELERHQLRDARAAVVDCARTVRDDPEGLARRLGGRREIRLFGLHDTRGGWTRLLRALAESPAIDRIVIYTSAPLELGRDLPATRDALVEDPSVAARLFGEVAERVGRFDVIEAPSIERELAEVAGRVRRLLDDGVQLERIAVVTRRARPYTDLALRALRRFNVPATARRRLAYREVPVVQAVLTVFAAAAGGWARRQIVELADQPYLKTDLDGRVLDFLGRRRSLRGLDRWLEALDELEREAVAHEADEHASLRERSLPRAARVRKAQRSFQTFAGYARGLDRRRPLAAWVRWLHDFVEQDPWLIERRIYDIPDGRYDIARRDLAAWRGVRTIVDEWLTALDQWGSDEDEIAAGAFHVQLEQIFSGELAMWTEVLAGVKVVEATSAAYRTFDHVFLVGMDAGRFPLPPPRSPIIDEADRDALHQAGHAIDRQAGWEARERELFRVIVAGARHGFTASYPMRNTAGQDTIRSAFLDALSDAAVEHTTRIDPGEVCAENQPLYATPEILRHAQRVAEVERTRAVGERSSYDGRIDAAALRTWLARRFGETHEWSATQLEAFARCPWAFFSERVLQLGKLEEPGDELEATVQGSVLHAALRYFYEIAAQRRAGPVFLRASDAEWAEAAALEALDQAFDDATRTSWLGAPALREARRKELGRIVRRYVAWEIQHHEDMFNRRKRSAPRILRTGVVQHEVPFRDVALERRGTRAVFRGRVDRVEMGIDERIPSAEQFVAAVDYKSSRTSAPGGGDKEAWDDGVVLQLPLYAHALAQIVPGARVSAVEYRALMQRERVHALDLHVVEHKSGVRHVDAEGEQRLEQALDDAMRHVERIRAGEFPARPAPSCLCPSYCHAWDICRTPNGPRVKRNWREQSSWS